MSRLILVFLIFPFFCFSQTTEAFISGNDTICDNSTINANVYFSFNGTSPFTFTYSINGLVQSSITTMNSFYTLSTKTEGIYNLVAFNDAAQSGTVNGQALVTLKKSPVSNFIVSPDTITNLNLTTQLFDNSTGYIKSRIWDFGDNSPYQFALNPIHTYTDSSNLYKLTLIVEDENGCFDTSFNYLHYEEESWMYIPNAFTPDLDGINDNFCLYYNGIRENTFILNLFNKSSQLIFSTNNLNSLNCENNTLSGWNGRDLDGNKVPTGVYIYKIYYQDVNGWKYNKTNSLVLIR